jgi:hypothetical protein
MFTTKKAVFCTMFVILLLSTTIYSQEVGQIFDKNEADQLYGIVLEKMVINADELKDILQSVNDKVMFLLEKKQITILGDNRSLLYCNSNFIETNQLFHMFSKSKVIELLYKGNEQTVILENRKEVFSITVGNYTLETSFPCPPFCE